MLSVDSQYEYIDWWHEALPGSGEGFAHIGDLSSFIFEPKITIGLSNYWNLTISQKLGNRHMNWKGDTTTIHHRDEGTHTDFRNALGGYLGDLRLTGRYLVFNDGQGDGRRFYIGGGLIIPSKNTITRDPFFLNGEEVVEHRHFSLSNGVYNGLFEAQYFIKQSKNPVFYGGAFSIRAPLFENSYGYRGSSSYELSFNGFSKLIKKINASLGGNFIFQHNTDAYWGGKRAPNSKSTVLVCGLGALWNLPFGGVSLGIQKPLFLTGGFVESGDNIAQEVQALQFTISFRKVLDWVVPWIDPLKGL